MEKQYKLQNIVTDLIENIKKQDFLVYFRKISLLKTDDKNVTFWVVSAFMKDNLKAKFYKEIFNSTKKEFSNIEKIFFEIDIDIDNLSNKNVIDCTNFYKENSKNKKSKKIKDQKKDWIYKTISSNNSVKERYNLANFVVGW